jgi:hypothetical protein
MCVIYACHSATPSDEELKQGAEGNTDGAGIAWVDKINTKEATVRWTKGLVSTPEAVKDIIEKNKITYPFAIHYRTASIGGKSADLTHPFPITDKLEPFITGHCRRVLMHNGHINQWKDWFKTITFSAPDFQIPQGPWSDSRALAAAVNLKGEGVLEFIIDTSRVMVLDALASSGWKKDNPKSYIRMYGTWIEKEGYFQSTETVSRNIVQVADEWRRNRHSHIRECKVIGGSKSSTVITSSSEVHAENTWTVDELERLISVLRKEQDEARILLGV